MHGVVGLTKSVALEHAAQGIRVNAVCPDAVRTPMTDAVIEQMPEMEQGYIELKPLRRMAEPAEMASAVLWLRSDEASCVTGESMRIDGGICAQ